MLAMQNSLSPPPAAAGVAAGCPGDGAGRGRERLARRTGRPRRLCADSQQAPGKQLRPPRGNHAGMYMYIRSIYAYTAHTLSCVYHGAGVWFILVDKRKTQTTYIIIV